MTNRAPSYAFSDKFGGSRKVHHTRRSRRSKKDESTDQHATDAVSVDANSLSYSAASSVNSGFSAGESTDSSFADIMKVLDLQDRDELAALMKKEGLGDYRKANQMKKMSSGVSIASSLAYSTDQESALESTLGGEALLQNLTGQPTDGYGPDLGDALGPFDDEPSDFDIDNNILFAPADPFDKKKKKSHKESRGSRSKLELKNSSQPSSLLTTPTKQEKEENSSGGSVSTPTPRSPDVKAQLRSRSKTLEAEDESCTPKWWMCGFSEAFRDLFALNW